MTRNIEHWVESPATGRSDEQIKLTFAIGQYTTPSPGTYMAGCAAFADKTRSRFFFTGLLASAFSSAGTSKKESEVTAKEAPFPTVELVTLEDSSSQAFDPRALTIKLIAKKQKVFMATRR